VGPAGIDCPYCLSVAPRAKRATQEPEYDKAANLAAFDSRLDELRRERNAREASGITVSSAPRGAAAKRKRRTSAEVRAARAAKEAERMASFDKVVPPDHWLREPDPLLEAILNGLPE